MRQVEGCTEPGLRDRLASIATDEGQHAELAWGTVAWALAVHPELRAAVDQAFARNLSWTDPEEVFVEGVSAHGRLTRQQQRHAVPTIVRHVITPLWRQLCGDGSRGSADRQETLRSSDVLTAQNRSMPHTALPMKS
jgi:hypothetical protein